MENERIGYRNCSLPFDWLITSNFSKVINLIKYNFENFLSYPNLQQEMGVNLNYYYDTKNEIHFYHDFNGSKSLLKQISSVQEKYSRRITRFYEIIKNPTLFIRYCSSQDIQYIQSHYQEIIEILRTFNQDNDIIYICDDEKSSFPESVKVFYVKKDKHDTVARHYLRNNKDLYCYITQCIVIDEEKRQNNIGIYKKKRQKRIILKVITKVKSIFNR